MELVLIMQNDLHSHFTTRVVAPLIAMDKRLASNRIAPSVEIGGIRYKIAIHLINTVPARNLGSLVASLRDREPELKNAIDLIFFGI